MSETMPENNRQDLWVQKFPNGTFGTKIFWSNVPGMKLVKFTQMNTPQPPDTGARETSVVSESERPREQWLHGEMLVESNTARELEARALKAEQELAEARERLAEMDTKLEGALLDVWGLRDDKRAQAGEIGRLKDTIRSIPNHTTETGGSFNQWHREICEICHKALSASSGEGVSCKWEYNDAYCYYETTCGFSYCFEHEFSTGKAYSFCPGCGKRIEIKAANGAGVVG